MTDIEFKVGQEHENMKGVYKVLSVKKDTLSICWESGEEIKTSAVLQNRIIERMQRERALTRGTKKGGKGKTKKPRLPEHVTNFQGLKEDDFSKGFAGGAWRHYDGLGGEVAVRLNPDKFDMASWPRYGLPEICWADFDRRHHDDPGPQTRFFARLHEDCLYSGLCIGGDNGAIDAKDEPNAFFSWLRDPENECLLKEIVSKHDCSVYNIEEEHAFPGTILIAAGNWCLLNQGRKQEIESLCGFLDGLSNDDRPLDIQIAKIVSKDKVVRRGINIVDDITQLFELLMPLYEACVVSG